MSETAVYRKYRPQNFDEVLGQEHITKVLKNSVEQNSFAHAYLFAGSRGTGKTSIARILAKNLGCSDNDIYEIDAASNRGIDDIRELREAVNSLPFDSPYKTYIIDEAHMLTKEAFNALLKTLEEPPAHTVFVLATTEFDKLPATISSRCQSFSFKKPEHQLLKQVISNIAEKEGARLEQPSIDLIALLSEGSFRDAQGVLQKVIAASGGSSISHDEVARIVGAPKEETVNELLRGIQEQDLEKALSAVGTAAEENIDMKFFMSLVLRKMRAVILLRYVPAKEEQFKESFSDNDMNFVKELSGQTEPKINSLILKKFLSTYTDISKANIPQLPIELTLVEMLGEGNGN